MFLNTKNTKVNRKGHKEGFIAILFDINTFVIANEVRQSTLSLRALAKQSTIKENGVVEYYFHSRW